MITIYHNPRCSKSRASLELLESKGLNPVIIKYLDTPPDKNELEQILEKLGMQAAQIVRKGERLYSELGLKNKTLSHQQWLDILVENPQLIERPIVVNGQQAAIGRPIERVLDIL